MPPACSICTHVGLRAIERALGRGTSLRTIARRWSVSKTALLRHRDRHGHAREHAPWSMPAVATPVAAPHPLAACAAAILAHCLPEVRQQFEEAPPPPDWPLCPLLLAR